MCETHARFGLGEKRSIRESPATLSCNRRLCHPKRNIVSSCFAIDPNNSTTCVKITTGIVLMLCHGQGSLFVL